uniref:Methenyltetrahydrofolate cyclohydrolase n=2 Tax=Pyramimonas obovata TaxID=1411642 RepID=A0A7S0WZ01_9CHLO|mmetsp:Transcript_9467/g.19602  ORF Transcript_9467/g.19602 Transcript_9467/m.19602 type:complete len:338 (+) Transcript_9467:135-1148(+)
MQVFGAIGNAIQQLPFPGKQQAKSEFKVINGKEIAATITKEIQAEVADLKEKTGKVPGLAVVIVGTRGDSQTYVNMKKKKCAECGIASFGKELPETVTQEELLKVVQDFNADPAVHGILVQLPLPKHIDEATILSAISIEKDVDGFHPLNIGALSMKGREPLFVPCTPKGCIELLDRSGVSMKGKHAVVLGRSNIVGMPAAMLLLKRDATVSIVHSRTVNPEAEVKRADIIIACCGQTQIVKKNWIKKGAVIIDVGTNAVTDASKKAGFRLVGDVDYEDAKQVASMCTPVPGGVGPMTIAMLMRNTCDSGKRAYLNEHKRKSQEEVVGEDKRMKTSS